MRSGAYDFLVEPADRLQMARPARYRRIKALRIPAAA
jgi:hypothetical protein